MKQSRKQFKMFFKIEKWLTENQKWLRSQPDKCSKRSNNMSMTNGEIKILEFLQKPKDACLRHNKSLGLHLFFCAMQNGWYLLLSLLLGYTSTILCVFDTVVKFPQRKLSTLIQKCVSCQKFLFVNKTTKTRWFIRSACSTCEKKVW